MVELLPVLSVEEAETALDMAKRCTEDLERRLNALIEENGRMLRASEDMAEKCASCIVS